MFIEITVLNKGWNSDKEVWEDGSRAKKVIRLEDIDSLSQDPLMIHFKPGTYISKYNISMVEYGRLKDLLCGLK